MTRPQQENNPIIDTSVMNKVKFSLITLLLLIVSSITWIPIGILYLNRALIAPIVQDNDLGFYIVSTILSIISLVLFYNSESTLTRLISTAILVIFAFPIFLSVTSRLETLNIHSIYFVFLANILSGFTLLLAEWIKSKKIITE